MHVMQDKLATQELPAGASTKSTCSCTGLAGRGVVRQAWLRDDRRRRNGTSGHDGVLLDQRQHHPVVPLYCGEGYQHGGAHMAWPSATTIPQ